MSTRETVKYSSWH